MTATHETTRQEQTTMIIDVKNLQKTYGSGSTAHVAVSDVSFTAAQ